MPAGKNYCISEGMVSDCIKVRNGTEKDDRVVLDIVIRNHFLHPNHPLGWIRNLSLSINGQQIDQENIVFELREQKIPLKLIPNISDIWWYMFEDAHLLVEVDSGILHQKNYHLSCTFEISLHVHTPNIDRTDIWPRLSQSISADAQIVE